MIRGRAWRKAMTPAALRLWAYLRREQLGVKLEGSTKLTTSKSPISAASKKNGSASDADVVDLMIMGDFEDVKMVLGVDR